MALRSGYDCVFGVSGLRDGYNTFERAPPALRSGYDAVFSGAAPLSLREPLDYQGRVTQTVPSGAMPLPRARGGTRPYTYTYTNLPAGLTVGANGVLAGTPTTAVASNTVTMSVTDSADTPATVSQDFEFPIIATNADITLKDFAGRGYHVNTFTGIVYAMAGECGSNIGFINNTDWWLRPPRGTNGELFTDPEQDLGFGPNDTTLTRFRWGYSSSNQSFIMNHSNTNAAGATVAELNFRDWDDSAEAQGKALYIGKIDHTFLKFVVNNPTQPRLWVGGTHWCRWQNLTDADTTYMQTFQAGTEFCMMIADA